MLVAWASSQNDVAMAPATGKSYVGQRKGGVGPISPGKGL